MTGELRLPLDVLRLLAASPGLRSAPRGDGRPVKMNVDPDVWRVVAERLARDA
jgi:hypothetical protein